LATPLFERFEKDFNKLDTLAVQLSQRNDERAAGFIAQRDEMLKTVDETKMAYFHSHRSELAQRIESLHQDKEQVNQAQNQEKHHSRGIDVSF